MFFSSAVLAILWVLNVTLFTQMCAISTPRLIYLKYVCVNFMLVKLMKQKILLFKSWAVLGDEWTVSLGSRTEQSNKVQVAGNEDITACK